MKTISIRTSFALSLSKGERGVSIPASTRSARTGSFKQRGAALMVSMMFLLVLTMLGLAAVRATTQQTRMAAGMQFQTSAFQAGETAIRAVLNEVNASMTQPAQILALAAQGAPLAQRQRTPNFGAGAVVASVATVTYFGKCPGLVEGFEVGGPFDVCCLDIEGSAQYGSSSAASVQDARVSLLCPKS